MLTKKIKKEKKDERRRHTSIMITIPRVLLSIIYSIRVLDDLMILAHERKEKRR
jgi:hypothetical protein